MSERKQKTGEARKTTTLPKEDKLDMHRKLVAAGDAVVFFSRPEKLDTRDRHKDEEQSRQERQQPHLRGRRRQSLRRVRAQDAARSGHPAEHRLLHHEERDQRVRPQVAQEGAAQVFEAKVALQRPRPLRCLLRKTQTREPVPQRATALHPERTGLLQKAICAPAAASCGEGRASAASEGDAAGRAGSDGAEVEGPLRHPAAEEDADRQVHAAQENRHIQETQREAEDEQQHDCGQDRRQRLAGRRAPLDGRLAGAQDGADHRPALQDKQNEEARPARPPERSRLAEEGGPGPAQAASLRHRSLSSRRKSSPKLPSSPTRSCSRPTASTTSKASPSAATRPTPSKKKRNRPVRT